MNGGDDLDEGPFQIPANSNAHRIRLLLQCAMEEHLGQMKTLKAYVVMAGVGHRTQIRVVPKLIAQHGGDELDWQKVTSTSNWTDSSTGDAYQTHAYLKISTGEFFYPKIQPKEDRRGVSFHF